MQFFGHPEQLLEYLIPRFLRENSSHLKDQHGTQIQQK